MKFVLAIENERAHQNDLFEAIKSVDPQLQVRFFQNLDEFYSWLKIVMSDGSRALAVAGNSAPNDPNQDLVPSDADSIVLTIISHDLFDVSKFHLITKAHAFFVRKKMILEANPAGIIITSFDNPHENLRLIQHPLLRNILYKPFDKLILRQHMEYALKPNEHFSPSAVATIDASSKVEMMIDMSLSQISETGFTVPLARELEIGEQYKFYSNSFESKDGTSVYARFKNQDKDKQLQNFEFFLSTQEQIHHLEKFVHESPTGKQTLSSVPDKKIKILMLDGSPPAGLELLNDFSKSFPESKVFHYSHFAQAMLDLEDKDTPHRKVLPEFFNLILVNLELIEGDGKKRPDLIINTLADRAQRYARSDKAQPLVYIFGKTIKKPEALLEYKSFAHDIFFVPLNRTYVFKKILSFLNYSGTKAIEIQARDISDKIQLSHLVQVTKISEASVSIQSTDKLEIGDFREFLLKSQATNETYIILARVHFVNHDAKAKTYQADFVFYGITDSTLKQVRLWLRKTYIDSKEGSGS